MNKIEQAMSRAVHCQQNWAGGNTSVVFSDSLPKGYAGEVFLHGNRIAWILTNGELEADRDTMRKWQTRTTASRMRALGFQAYFKNGRFYYSPFTVAA